MHPIMMHPMMMHTLMHTLLMHPVLYDTHVVILRAHKRRPPHQSPQAYDEPLARVHFRGEGDVEFTAVLYLPKSAPFDMYDSYYSRKAQVKLYVRRVFITDEMEDFLPKYLSFLVGLVDSDSLPLNVSREMLQQHASLKTIKKKIVRKALDMIKRLADAEKAKRGGEELDEETAALADKYTTFWKEFGKALKLGIIEDATNRNRLAKLMRFHTSSSGEELTDLEEYIGRMKEGQKHIYFLTGECVMEVVRRCCVMGGCVGVVTRGV